MVTRVKICCINSLEEANIAIKHGASAIGLVGHMPSGPGVIFDDMIHTIAKSIPPPIGTFLLTSETSYSKIIDHHKKTLTNTIQIVDYVVDSTYKKLRKAIPLVKIVQVIHVVNKNSVNEAIRVSELVDAILLDSGNPNLKIKELGGTGRVHDWNVSRQIREKVNVPVFLAGGLNAENVKNAIEIVQPFGVDVCSGVRTNGKLDEAKLIQFMQQVSG